MVLIPQEPIQLFVTDVVHHHKTRVRDYNIHSFKYESISSKNTFLYSGAVEWPYQPETLVEECQKLANV